jgi:hypothetical protein
MSNVNNANRQFLDYKGLETLWEKIKETFPYRTESIAEVKFNSTGSGVQLQYTKADGTNDNIILPIADTDNAGVITSNTFDTIMQLKGGSADLVPIAGLKINSKVASLNDRYANIKLDYNTKTGADGEIRSYLSLVDSNFIGNAHWYIITEEAYNEATNDGTGSKKGYTKVKESDGSYSYYKWDAGDYNCEPAYDNYGPILATPISEIDVTEFVKSGILKTATYDSTKLEILLEFYTYNYETNTSGTKVFTIPVKDFIDEYQEGEGISITSDVNYGDHEKNISVISLVDAKNDKLGGIKVAKDNEGISVNTITSNINTNVTDSTPNKDRYIGVETDKDNKAFVYVPWMNTSVTTEGENNKHGLILSSGDTNLTNSISLGTGTVASLKKADTAIQTLSILGYNLDHEAKTSVSTAEAISALELKSASHIDHIETFTDLDATTTATNDTKLPTRGAVKTYVTEQITTFKEGLDSSVTPEEFTIVRTEYAENDAYRNHVGLKMFNEVKLEDGVLKSVSKLLSIYDIADFVPLTAADINEICTID